MQSHLCSCSMMGETLRGGLQHTIHLLNPEVADLLRCLGFMGHQGEAKPTEIHQALAYETVAGPVHLVVRCQLRSTDLDCL